MNEQRSERTWHFIYYLKVQVDNKHCAHIRVAQKHPDDVYQWPTPLLSPKIEAIQYIKSGEEPLKCFHSNAWIH